MKHVRLSLAGCFFALGLFLLPSTQAQTPYGAMVSLTNTLSQHLTVPSGIWFSNAFTVEAWVYERSVGSWARLIDFGNGPSDDNLLCALSQGTSGEPIFQWFNGATQVASVQAPSPLPLNTWTHLAFTYTNGTQTILINGSPVATATGVLPPNSITRMTNYIGRSLYAGDAYANANFDEFRIWNVARTAAQIRSAMGAPLNGDEPGLVLYYRFDETNTPTALNSAIATGAADNGTYVNSPTNIPSTVPFPPAVATTGATGTNGTTYTFQGTVNPGNVPSIAYFEYGTTTNYGSYRPTNSLPATNVTLAVSSLAGSLGTGLNYHFQLVVSNLFGVTLGGDMILTTTFLTRSQILTNIVNGTIAVGDYDGDGLLDFVVAGTNTVTALPEIDVWRNNGDGTFSNIDFAFPEIAVSSFAWGDYNNDGLPDLLLSGTTNGPLAEPRPTSQIWRNNGDGTFSNIQAGLIGVQGGTVEWGDYNNDGRLDVLLCGRTSNPKGGGGTGATTITQIWLNNGDSTFSKIGITLTGGTQANGGDYNNDGFLDILISATNKDPRIVANNGQGHFATAPNLPSGNSGYVAWGDYDNDGILDVFFSLTSDFIQIGGDGSPTISNGIWQNDGHDNFTSINFGFSPNTLYSSASWADYDNDGRLDLLLQSSAGLEIWRNNGDGTFTKVNAGLPLGQGVWGDFDNDGRLDILTAGPGGVILCQNQNSQVNTPPNPPTGLSASLSGTSLVFTWNAASDAQTPAAALTYNLRVGSSPGASDILAPEATSAGTRLIPQRGAVQGTLTHQISISRFGTFYWSVQAIDGAYAGSAFATESSINLLPIQAPLGATSIVPGDLNGDGIVDQDELNAVLSNYLPYSPWLMITNTAGLGTSNVEFSLTNANYFDLSVLVSTNLTDWDFLGTAHQQFQFSDPNATNQPQRYYRLRWP